MSSYNVKKRLVTYLQIPDIKILLGAIRSTIKLTASHYMGLLSSYGLQVLSYQEGGSYSYSGTQTLLSQTDSAPESTAREIL
jgi:hypothetical protein